MEKALDKNLLWKGNDLKYWLVSTMFPAQKKKG